MARAEPVELPVKIKLDAEMAVVRPGDTLVIGLHPAVTPEHAGRIKAEAEERLPGVRVVIFDQVAGMAVYAADEVTARRQQLADDPAGGSFQQIDGI